MKKQRLRIFLIGLFLVLSIWIAWPETKLSEKPNSAQHTEEKRKRFGWHQLGFGQNDDQKRTLNRTQSTAETASSRIDRLIAHPTLSDREVAEQLRKIAEDKGVSEEVRAEAMGHGVLLDLAIFADMASDNQLPEVMADNLLQNVLNENSNPALQIRVYKDFLNHQASEIREEAKQVLAFILEDDAREADDAALLQMADAKLKQIEVEKLVEE